MEKDKVLQTVCEKVYWVQFESASSKHDSFERITQPEQDVSFFDWIKDKREMYENKYGRDMSVKNCGIIHNAFKQ